MGRYSKHVKAQRRQQLADAQVDSTGENRVPKSFVFRRGKVGEHVSQLIQDMRKVMSPNTAMNLQERKANQLRDFVHVAPTLNVSHFLMFSQTPVGTNLRICRVPRGPTLTFRVLNYSTIRDITNMQKHPHSPGNEYNTSPLVVLNGFSAAAVMDESLSEPMKITATMLQNMFPPIDLQSIQLIDCRRVVLIVRDAATQLLELRHYLIQATPVGLTRSVKKIVKAKLPNLGNMNDISDYVLQQQAAGNNTSDSEAEDSVENRITLTQAYAGRGNKKSGGKAAIRLQELGPRLQLQLLKIEEGLCDGAVLYHAYVQKSDEEKQQLEKRKQRAVLEKQRRKQEQQANVDNKKKSGSKRKYDSSSNNNNDDSDIELPTSHMSYNDEDKSDAQYYREAVGAEADEGEFAPREERMMDDESENNGSSSSSSSKSSKPMTGKKQKENFFKAKRAELLDEKENKRLLKQASDEQDAEDRVFEQSSNDHSSEPQQQQQKQNSSKKQRTSGGNSNNSKKPTWNRGRGGSKAS